MHRTNHALLVNTRRMDKNKIRSGDRIQNCRDRKFCRLMSCRDSPPYNWNTCTVLQHDECVHDFSDTDTHG